MTTKPIDIALVGAGNRGLAVYGRYIRRHPNQFRLVAVADPNTDRRELAASQHDIPLNRQFSAAVELFARPQLARAVIIATQDQYHVEPALAALERGYDVLLEKPMAHRRVGCLKLVKASQENGRLLQISHVLRYTPVMQKVKRILIGGELGDIITVSHRENVSFWHMAHSYVRGNWRNTTQASPMILAKCSHDFDLLYWLLEQRCAFLSSVGSLRHFQLDQAPAGVPQRCTDGCPIAASCPYEATNIYLHLQPFVAELRRTRHPVYRLAGRLADSRLGRAVIKGVVEHVPTLHRRRQAYGWPRSAISAGTDDQSVLEALETGPYGRCVYHCDNDVVDHQVVAMEFEGGISVTLTMHGHSPREGRSMRIDGTRATLFARMNLFESEVKVHHHRGGKVDRYYIPHAYGEGHGGGDAGLMEAFYRALTDRRQPPMTTAEASLESHLLAFAAEDARLEKRVIDMERYRARAWAALEKVAVEPAVVGAEAGQTVGSSVLELGDL